ncbi:MAG: methyltransferase domain-containing protein [Alphaproteobacteria bacterium]|nr:methyltransferase domain-containing protein [Alphaproteobacteria bacterium]
MLLGREPESAAVVQAFVKGTRTVEELRRLILRSPEFAAKFEREQEAALAVGERLPMSAATRNVQTRVNKSELDRLLGRIEREFAYMGESEPFWSVISTEQYKLANLSDDSKAQFYQSGRQSLDEMEATARRNGVKLPRAGICFELGCGIGRTTIWLANAFQKVIAAELSAPHLALAQKAVTQYGKRNISFLHVNARHTFATLPEFDAFLSIIVFQHNPPPLIYYMLTEILGRLRPGGVAYFQVPTYGLNYEFVLQDYLQNELPPGTPEMHVLPQPELFRVIDQTGCELLEIREDGAAGPDMISNRLFVRKKSKAIAGGGNRRE